MRTLTHASLFALAVVLGSDVHATPRERPDKEVTYFFDLTREGDAKPTVLAVTLPPKYWQHSDHPPLWAPGTAVRKGWGAAWFYFEDYYNGLTQAHVMLEIEDLGKRTLAKAAKDHNAKLDEICTKASSKLKSKPRPPKRFKKFKLGRKKTTAYHTRYTVRPQGATESAVDPTRVLFFAVNRHLVILTAEKAGAHEPFDAIVKGFRLVKTAAPKKEHPFKLVDLTDGVCKFITFDWPAGFKRVYRYEHGKPDAVWERRAKEGKLLARLTLSNHRLKGAPLDSFVEKRTAAYEDHYEDVTKPVSQRVGDRPGLAVTYRDASRDEEPDVRNVSAVFFKVHREAWQCTWETMGEDDALVEKDRKVFRKLLSSVEAWRSKVE
jgi:hypothetical protein